MKVIRNGKIEDVNIEELQAWSIHDALAGTVESLKTLKANTECLLANKPYIMSQAEIIARDPEAAKVYDIIWAISHNGIELKVWPTIGSCASLKATKLLDAGTRWAWNCEWALPRIKNHLDPELYPIEGSIEYGKQSHKGLLWINPKRWEYIEALGKYADELIAKF